MTVYCDFCGVELDDSASKCPICGHELRRQAAPGRNAAQQRSAFTVESVANALKTNNKTMLAAVWALWLIAQVIALMVDGEKAILSILILSLIFGWMSAGRIVGRLYDSVLGGLMLIAPIMTFIYIALIKVVLRLIIAPFVGWFVAPSIISGFLSKQLNK